MIAFLEKMNAVGSPILLFVLLFAGIYLSLGTGFFQIFRFPAVLKHTVGSLFAKKGKNRPKDGITPFQAVSTALAGTLGTGNIVGVATAIVAGGPGAIFWMVVSAFLGMITKYAEVLLAVHYQTKNKSGQLRGGPMYYMRDALGMPKLGMLFAVVCVLASFGIGNMVQVNSVSSALSSAFGWNETVIGIGIALVVAAAAFGGMRQIAGICEKLVPLMAVFYFGACFWVLGVHFDRIPAAVSTIFDAAFHFRAVGGGVIGYTAAAAIRFGVSRGIFTNEAGLGSAPIAHGSAQAASPVKQGMWGIFEVFFDTVVMCTLTALVVLTSGLWDSGLDGAALTTAAFSQVIGPYASGFIAVSTLFFAVSSILGWYYYGTCCLEFLSSKQTLLKLYQILFFLAAVWGAVINLQAIWAVSDLLNLLMFLPNIAAVLLLSKVVFEQTRGFKQENSKKKKQKKTDVLSPTKRLPPSGTHRQHTK